MSDDLTRSMVRIFFTGPRRWQRALEFRLLVSRTELNFYLDELDVEFVRDVEEAAFRRNGLNPFTKFIAQQSDVSNYVLISSLNSIVEARLLNPLPVVIYAGNFHNGITTEVLGLMYGNANGWDMRLYPEEVELWYERE